MHVTLCTVCTIAQYDQDASRWQLRVEIAQEIIDSGIRAYQHSIGH
jgi:hypothetical protein